MHNHNEYEKMTAPIEIVIEDVGAQGDGIAHHDGITTFVSGVLAGERAKVMPSERNENYQRAALLEVITPSKIRVKPPCPLFPLCGGCRLQHMDAEAYSAWKMEQLKQTLTQEGLKDVHIKPTITTPPASRCRARVAIEHRKNGVVLGFNEWRSHNIVNMTACPVLLPEMVAFLKKLREEIAVWLPVEGSCDAQLTALAGGFDLVLIGGPDLNLKERQTLSKMGMKLNIAQLSWRKWDRSPIVPVTNRTPLSVNNGHTSVPFPAGAFLQATQAGESALIDFARLATNRCEKILDLFCGLGGFGLSIINAKKVCFADFDGASIAALNSATQHSSTYNVTQRNLIGNPFSAKECNSFDAVIFDPPRGGAKAQAAQLSESHTPNIVAVSCDPPSFARDAKILASGGYTLQALQPVDQFLWSTHMELIAHFER